VYILKESPCFWIFFVVIYWASCIPEFFKLLSYIASPISVALWQCVYNVTWQINLPTIANSCLNFDQISVPLNCVHLSLLSVCCILGNQYESQYIPYQKLKTEKKESGRFSALALKIGLFQC